MLPASRSGDGRIELAVVDGSASWDDERLPVIQTSERHADGFLGPQRPPITQEAALAGDDPRSTDDFGNALAEGDFDVDGYADLAIGVPGRGCLECDEEHGYGEVVVLQGFARGLTVTGRTVWTQDSFTVLLGSRPGLTTAGYGGTTFTQATPGIGGAPGPNGFGLPLAAAYVQRVDQASLVIAADRQTVGGVPSAGQINQLAAGAGGPQAQGSRTIHRNTAGVTGKPVRFGQFGFRVS